MQRKKEKEKGTKMVEGQCKCGSTTHLRTSHKQCPYNKRLNDAPIPPHIADDISPPHSDLSDDNLSPAGDNLSDESESTSNDIGAMKMTLSVVTCVCGALGRAHKRDCPMSSRSTLPTEVYSTDCCLSQSDSVWKAAAKPKPNWSKLGKRKIQEVDKRLVIKKQRITTSSFEVGDSVCLHSSRLVKKHVPCRIVRKSRKGYQL